MNASTCAVFEFWMLDLQPCLGFVIVGCPILAELFRIGGKYEGLVHLKQ